jgi:hypothetical protein
MLSWAPNVHLVLSDFRFLSAVASDGLDEHLPQLAGIRRIGLGNAAKAAAPPAAAAPCLQLWPPAQLCASIVLEGEQRLPDGRG